MLLLNPSEASILVILTTSPYNRRIFSSKATIKITRYSNDLNYFILRNGKDKCNLDNRKLGGNNKMYLFNDLI